MFGEDIPADDVDSVSTQTEADRALAELKNCSGKVNKPCAPRSFQPRTDPYSQTAVSDHSQADRLVDSRRTLPHQRCVLIGAPHTSNWDFPLMLMVVLKLELRVFWMGKHTLFPFPFGWLMKWLGGIPIDRSASHNMVSETVRQYAENDELVVLIPPEGTHAKGQAVEEWFLSHLANNAKVPILLGYVDANKKQAGFADFYSPSGDYRQGHGKSEHSTPIRPA